MLEKLPKTPKDLFQFSLAKKILFEILIFLAWLFRYWKYPPKAQGDIKYMTFWDKVYWLYKTTHPTRRARKKSGLETYFQDQKSKLINLPPNFQIHSQLSISSVGDLINHPFLKSSRQTLYPEVEEIIFNVDLPMANLECPIYTTNKEFVFSLQKAPPLYYDIDSFNVVKGTSKKKYSFMATACNHSLDFGAEGIQSTIESLKTNNIAYSGINASEEKAFEATLIELKNIKVGVFAYTFGLNAYMPPADRPHIVNTMNLNGDLPEIDFEQLKKQIDYCKKNQVDFIIAHLHWGLEHEFYPTPEQVNLAHHLAELGVDAIIGHHPHVIQPLEYYTCKRDISRMVPIFYSLGNLVNSFSAEYLCKSAVARITLAKGSTQDNKTITYVQEARMIEVTQEVDPINKTLAIKPC